MSSLDIGAVGTGASRNPTDPNGPDGVLDWVRSAHDHSSLGNVRDATRRRVDVTIAVGVDPTGDEVFTGAVKGMGGRQRDRGFGAVHVTMLEREGARSVEVPVGLDDRTRARGHGRAQLQGDGFAHPHFSPHVPVGGDADDGLDSLSH